ncbi:MAG: hypothetical protein MN733_36910, partial [Nitrososphaera sp.]|nr:hypothetical protein [Nitrososphaera sp.]
VDHRLMDRVLFSTLNYDCVIEFSLLETGRAVSYFELPSDSQIPVWKLHGSCNMFSHSVRASKGVTYTAGVVFEGGLEAFLDSNRVIEHCLIETGLAPAMALYMEGKPNQISPSVIKKLQTLWAESVMSATAVIGVGVRPWPVDKHIWDPLAKTSSPLWFIGDAKEFDAWANAVRVGPTLYLGSRFNEAYPKLLERIGTL